MTGSFLLVIAGSAQNDSLPVVTSPLPVFSGLETAEDAIVDLGNHFTGPDDPDALAFEIVANTDPSVAKVMINGQEMVVDFLAPGQTNIYLKASHAGNELVVKTLVGVQPEITGDFVVSDFEDLSLDPETFWNGSDASGFFKSGGVNFHNVYDTDWFSWHGWAYSNISDHTTPGFVNQYSAITGAGFSGPTHTGNKYGVAYLFGPPVLSFSDGMAHGVEGFFITNSTYAALSMENGDDYSKKFGGSDESDPDYFKVIIWGYADGLPGDPVEFYLADFRFEDDTRDYIVKTWQWVDLTALGEVDSLVFDLASSDMGDWGMNTPAFFCADNFFVEPGAVSSGSPFPKGEREGSLLVYPNPGSGRFKIGGNRAETLDVTIYNMSGALIFENRHLVPGEVIDLAGLPAGSYLLRARGDRGVMSEMIQIH